MIIRVPGLDLFTVKAYQFRERGDSRHRGYARGNSETLPGAVAAIYAVRKLPAWRIAFTNTGNTTVSVMLNFSIHDKHGKRDDFAKVVRNLNPQEPADMDVTLSRKADKIFLDTVEVFGDDELISRTQVNRFLPRVTRGPKAWMVALALTGLSALFYTNLRPGNNLVNSMLPVLGLIVTAAGLTGRTPVVFVLLFLIALPFSNHTLQTQAALAGCVVVYLTVVWSRRRSWQDFFRATATV